MKEKDPHMTDTPPYKTPRWVKVSGIVAIVLVLLVVIMMFVGGNHGPGRHMPSGNQTGDLDGRTTPVERGQQP